MYLIFHLCQFKHNCECLTLIPDPYSIFATHSALQYRGIGSLANTIFKKSRKDNLNRRITTSDSSKCNAKITIVEKEMFILIAKKNILKGKEIFLDYGKKRFEFLDLVISYR